VQIKIRQGRKACTLVTGFEPFQLAADDLADVLRHTCASSTTGARHYMFTGLPTDFARPVAPLQGKNAGLEVMVQGKQMGPVTQLLMARGVPKRYIELEDMSDKKKK
jgi:translation initiation factor 2D